MKRENVSADEEHANPEGCRRMCVTDFLVGGITPKLFKREVVTYGIMVSQVYSPAVSTKTLYKYGDYLVLVDDDQLEDDCIVIIMKQTDMKPIYTSKHLKRGMGLMLNLGGA